MTGKENNFLYNQGTGEKTFKTERISALDLNVDMTKFRVMDPAVGTWWQIDPASESLADWTPYNYSFNNPIRYNDPYGDCPPGIDCKSYLIGLGASFLDNVTFGFTNVRESSADYISDSESFNLGQDQGDVLSMLGGFAMIEGGTGTAVAGTALAPETGGSTLVLTAVGTAEAVWGAGISGTAFGSFVNQKGRLNVESGKVGSESNPHSTSRQARRDSMRKDGIPTSQQPKSQSKNNAGRSYTYDVPESGGGTKTKEVQQQTLDRNHGPHWEAGTTKPAGQKSHGRPRLQNDKSKSYYKEK